MAEPVLLRMLKRVKCLLFLLVISQFVVDGQSVWLKNAKDPSPNIAEQIKRSQNPTHIVLDGSISVNSIQDVILERIKSEEMKNNEGSKDNSKEDAIEYKENVRTPRKMNKRTPARKRNVSFTTHNNMDSDSQRKQSRRLKREVVKRPWSVTIFATKSSQYSTSVKSENKGTPTTKKHAPPMYWCTGSLVGSHWILTSAHCVDTKAWEGLKSQPQQTTQQPTRNGGNRFRRSTTGSSTTGSSTTGSSTTGSSTSTTTAMNTTTEASPSPSPSPPRDASEPIPWGMNVFKIRKDTKLFVTPLELEIRIGDKKMTFVPKNGSNVFYHKDYVKYNETSPSKTDSFCYNSWRYFNPDLAMLKLPEDQTVKPIKLPKGRQEKSEDFFYNNEKCYSSNWNIKLNEERIVLKNWTQNGSKLFQHSCVEGDFDKHEIRHQVFAKMHKVNYFNIVPPNNNTADRAVIDSGGWLMCDLSDGNVMLAGLAHGVMTAVNGRALPLTDDGKSFKADKQLKVKPGTLTATLHYRASSFADWVVFVMNKRDSERRANDAAVEEDNDQVVVGVSVGVSAVAVVVVGVLGFMNRDKFSKKKSSQPQREEEAPMGMSQQHHQQEDRAQVADRHQPAEAMADTNAEEISQAATTQADTEA